MAGRIWMLVVLILSVSGCVSVVDGAAVRGWSDDVEQILLSDRRLNELLGSREIDTTQVFHEMTDETDDISHPECVGAIYTAEEPMYADTGYTAVQTRIGSEPGEYYVHWVQQTAVIVPTAEVAAEFVDQTAQVWQDCAGTTVTVDDGDVGYDWQLQQIDRRDGVLSQLSTDPEFGDWGCQHAMGAVSTVIVEALVCSERIDEEARTLVAEILANAG
ncbi:sensor domain-containing protein [Mycolicibacterium sp.]|uniref:sensor domain-containing protein n=1 Tax=Mycolicibacterium sp. TaxID=2320850 RepID=UPI003D0FD2E1